MRLHIALIGGFLTLAACGGTGVTNLGGGDGDGGGTGGGGGGGGGGGAATDTCAGAFVCQGDVLAVSYDGGADVLSITGTPFDETALAGTYVRAVADVNGIPTYVNDDPLRFNDYIAYLNTSSGGEVSVGTIGISGYQDFGYGGTYLLLTDPASVPSQGLVEFQGNVAGVLVYTGAGALDTSQGSVLMQVDFTDNRIKGFVTGRTSTSALGTLPDTLILNDTTITNGAFSGTVASYDGPDQQETGTYSGVFAGDADVIGGFYQATWGEFDTDITSRDTGVFIAEECPVQPCP